MFLDLEQIGTEFCELCVPKMMISRTHQNEVRMRNPKWDALCIPSWSCTDTTFKKLCRWNKRRISNWSSIGHLKCVQFDNWFWFHFKVLTFWVITVINPIEVQWEVLTPGGPLWWSRYLSRQLSKCASRTQSEMRIPFCLCRGIAFWAAHAHLVLSAQRPSTLNGDVPRTSVDMSAKYLVKSSPPLNQNPVVRRRRRLVNLANRGAKPYLFERAPTSK